MNIGIVFNPRAGQNKRDPEASERLARRLGDRGVVAAPRSVDELHRVAESFERQRIDVLGISGGDGTNHVTLTGFRRVYGERALPTVALLRGGTMNTVANAVGVPHERSERLVERLLKLTSERPTALGVLERDTVDVGGNLGFLFGTGVVQGFLKAYYDTGAPSPWTAVKTLSRTVASAFVQGPLIREMAAPVRAVVTLADGTVWPERDYLSVAGGTIAEIGLGFRPFHRFDEAPGTLHLLGIHSGPVGFALDLPRIFAARGMQPHKCLDAVTAGCTVRVTAGASRYMLDGDLFEGDGELRVAIGPRVRIATLRAS